MIILFSAAKIVNIFVISDKNNEISSYNKYK